MMMQGLTCRQVLAEAALALAQTSDTPRLDAELLMAHALGITREDLLLRHLDAPAPAAFEALLARRLAHEPIAYITGTRAFWTIDIVVGPGALIPRADSETLIEAAIDHFGAGGPARILDLGTGPGTLLLAALAQWPQAAGLGIDRSEAALAMARHNADRLALADRATSRSATGRRVSTSGSILSSPTLLISARLNRFPPMSPPMNRMKHCLPGRTALMITASSCRNCRACWHRVALPCWRSAIRRPNPCQIWSRRPG